MNSGLRREILFIIASGVLLLILGVLTGFALELLLAGVIAWIAWYIFNLSKLINWLSKPTKTLPESIGIWDELYYQIYHLYQRQRKARKKLKNMVNRFQSSTQALPIAAVALNRNNEIEWFNQAAERLFDLQQAKDVGVRINNLIRQPVFTNYLLNRDFKEMIDIDFNHRQLNIDQAVVSTRYRVGEVTYRREAFASYPDNVIAVRLEADQPGKIACTVSLGSPHSSAIPAVAIARPRA